jgi:uncharacterized radical SAM superfamily protein
MTDVSNVPDMFGVIDSLISSGGEGILVSGGCDMNGSVPIMRATDAIGHATRNGLRVNVHTGFIKRDDAERLVAAGVREFSVDVHQDPDIIRDVLRLAVRPDAYSDLLDNIIAVGGRPVAHLTAGFGTADLEMSADLVKKKGLREGILLALVPTKGTITEHSLISEDAVVDAAKMLIDMNFEVTLGCMRPRVHRALERRCITAGVRKIANPSRGTISWALDNGMKVIVKRMCCCFTR